MAAQAGSWGFCGGGLQIPAKPAEASSAQALRAADPGEIRMRADSADIVENIHTVLSGDVLIEKGLKTLAADKATYDETNESMDAEGNVRLWQGSSFLSSDAVQINFANDQIDATAANFLDLSSHGRATASQLRVSGSELVQIRNATYTTCNPGDPDWSLEADKLDLDRVSDVGTARNVMVHFKGYPIFYTPYLTFPLSSERKSGVLTPSFRLSGEAGTELMVPYYFNIAPNQDATVNTRITAKRGLVLGGEYRYLQPWGEGTLSAEVLPHDSERGGARGLLKLRHVTEEPQRFRAELHFDRVSDRDYFSDLGDSLDVSSTTHLRQRAELEYIGPTWNARGRVETFQTVDGALPSASRPYRRLPQLLLQSRLPRPNRALNYSYAAEYAYFDRSGAVKGHRFDLAPTVSFPVRSAGWFAVPSATLRYTAYSLQDADANVNDSPDRLIPTVSFDSGLFFERDTVLGGTKYLSTLEPRLHYLAVPFDDQRDLPLFDTGEFTFNFAQIFRNARFSGADRVGDAHQITVALTSRLLNPADGRELFRASIGQIQYLRDRKVTLAADGMAERRRSSDIVAELAALISPDWSVKGGLQWNTHDGRTEKNVFGLRYQPNQERVVNLTYRFIRDTVEQADASVRWPWNHSTNFVARFNYSLAGSRVLETFGGLEYESCCWAMRVIGRRFLTNERDYNNGIFLQLELKGLAGIGKKAGEFPEQSIPGYRNNF